MQCNLKPEDKGRDSRANESQTESLSRTAGRPVLRRDAWLDGIGPATPLAIQVPQPAITHTVTVQQLERWANGSAVNPDERIKKDLLKAMLTRTRE